MLKALFRSIVRHKRRWLVVSCVFFLLVPIGDNLTNLALAAYGPYPDWRITAADSVFMVGIFTLVVSFCCLWVMLRRRLFSEKWLIHILCCAVLGVVQEFSFENPYCDPPFYDSPLLQYIHALSCNVILSVFLIAPWLVLIHFALRNKRRRIALWRRMVMPVLAMLLTVAAFVVFAELQSLLC
ncbi:MAG: hypothetical protein MJ025_03650 [Victivallaceae bacterium]|nr:hypothetical protein [Victivallaceae bacterium]